MTPWDFGTMQWPAVQRIVSTHIQKSSYAFCCAVEGAGLVGLPPAEEIETLASTYQDSLSSQYAQQRVFPLLEFTFDGRIIGWTFAATENIGGQEPILTVWRPMPNDMRHFDLLPAQSEQLDECVTSMFPLDDGRIVFVHDSGPTSPGISFSRGDRLGLYLQQQSRADFVPYLYNGSLQSEVNSPDGTYSQYQGADRFRRGQDISPNSPRDQLLPLIALELCKSISIT